MLHHQTFPGSPGASHTFLNTPVLSVEKSCNTAALGHSWVRSQPMCVQAFPPHLVCLLTHLSTRAQFYTHFIHGHASITRNGFLLQKIK